MDAQKNRASFLSNSTDFVRCPPPETQGHSRSFLATGRSGLPISYSTGIKNIPEAPIKYQRKSMMNWAGRWLFHLVAWHDDFQTATYVVKISESEQLLFAMDMLARIISPATMIKKITAAQPELLEHTGTRGGWAGSGTGWCFGERYWWCAVDPKIIITMPGLPKAGRTCYFSLQLLSFHALHLWMVKFW